LFKPSLATAKMLPESHHRQVVDCSNPAFLGFRRKQVGLERSTSFRWWDSKKWRPFCRSGLNNPPPAGGGILKKWKDVGNDKVGNLPHTFPEKTKC